MQQYFPIRVFRLATLLIGSAFALTPLGAACGQAFSFVDVAREADRLARLPYREPPAADPSIAALSYDALRKQRFRAEFSTWRGGGTPYELQYFPLGNGVTRPLVMYEIVDGAVQPLELPAGAFENTASSRVAGWRLNRWIDRPRRSDEVGAFLGSNYFRLVAPGLQYGVSARGVAVDTAEASGEEFPAFSTYWMQRPQPGDTEVRFYALLESPRITGAYAFVLRPREGMTQIDVRARLVLRAPVNRLGIAPLTSMFLAGETQPMAQDYRPEVHDSDGLQVASGKGEWLWRPLTHPRGTFVTSLSLPSLRGFGLMQRDRAFASYQDLEARYELRPSAWVEPLGDWGPGRVELLQFPTPDETHDNVGAWWSPERMPAVGEPVEYAWRVTVSGSEPQPPGAWVTQSRRGHGYRRKGTPANQMQYHLDFSGPALEGLSSEGLHAVEAVATGNANVRNLRAIARSHGAMSPGALPTWRVTLDFERIDANQPVELRAFLRSGSRTLSETWSHAGAPE